MERFKHTIKNAFKNIVFNKKRYIYFIILLIFLQSLISCIILFNHNNNRNELKYLESEFQYDVDGENYPYHIILNNLTPVQYASLREFRNTFQTSTKFFELQVAETVPAGLTKRHYVYVYFVQPTRSDVNPYDLYKRFCRYGEIQELLEEGATITQTPYLLAYKSAFANNTVALLTCLIITAIGTLTFGILFNTVVNHFKFSYGIYMTYGANFRKLLGNALSEMLLLNFFTFIPAFLLSILITFLLTIRSGYGISVLVYPMFLALLCSSVMTVISVTFVMKRVSLYTPDKLLRSVNNAGLITSPRISKRIPDKGFPIKSEFLSMKRFRKYVVSYLLTTVIFCSVFSAGAYLMEVQSAKEAVNRPQFTITFPTEIRSDSVTTSATTAESPEETVLEEEEATPPLESATGHTYTEEVREAIYEIDGVDYIVKKREWAATLAMSHVLIKTDALSLSGRMNGVKASDGYTAFANTDFVLVDSEVADNLEYRGATITGDLTSVINGRRTVAISDSFNNSRQIKLKVGDTIKIAVSHKQVKKMPSGLPDSVNGMLEIFLKAYRFGYIEVTVGAIVSDLPTDESFPIYMNANLFSEVTGETPYFVDVEIYCAEGTSEENIRRIERELYDLQLDMAITNTRQETTRVTDEMKNYPGIILYVSILFLVIAVLIKSLSQSLFYQMRKQEMDIFLCLGAGFKQIKRLFLFDAFFFSSLAAVFYSVLAMILNVVVFKIANVNFGGELLRYDFSIPWWAFLTGLLVCVISAFATVMLSFYSYKRNSAPIFTGKAVDSVVDGDGSRNEIFDSDAR